MRNALILCAGSARRFYTDGESLPKCLLPMAENQTILDGLVRPLLERDYHVLLGTGCGHELVAECASEYPGVRCLFNPDYATTNSIVTLWQLRDFVGDETLLINGDLVIGEGAFDLFSDEVAPQLLVKHLPRFDDDTYRVVFEEEYSVRRMGKDIDDAPAPNVAAFTGISRVGDSDLFLGEIEKLLNAGTRDTWPTTAYRNLLGRRPVRAVPIGEMAFFDVDTPDDFEAARAAFAAGSSATSL